MIELLLQAERALSVGLVDEAERMYAQTVAADPRNAIAVVGLARVALERADDARAYRLARQALAIDPENVAAARLARRLEEVYAARGIAVLGTDAGAAPDLERASPVALAPVPSMVPTPVSHAPMPSTPPVAAPRASATAQPAPGALPPRRMPLERLFRRNRP